MEVYNDVENDAGDAYPHDAIAGCEHDEPGHNMQIVRHSLEEEENADRSDLIDMGVFKPTTGNATKRLRMRQETRESTSNAKTTEATLKQIANQEFQAEKGKMEIWKQVIMEEVGRQFQTMKEPAEAQKECFRVEMEELREQLREMEMKSLRLEKELSLVQAKEENLGEQPGKGTSGMRRNQAPPAGQQKSRENSVELIENEKRQTQIPRNENVAPVSQSSSTPRRNYAVAASQSAQAPQRPPRKNYAQIAASNSPKVTTENAWTEVTSGRKQKTNPLQKVEPEKRRIIFRREVTSPQKSEADLMLVLNEALQQTNLPAYIRFSKVGYSQSGAISGLLTEKSNVEDLLRDYSTTLIRAAKSVDEGVIGVEKLERWHRLKEHGMLLIRYLGEGKMELLCREIESSTGIRLKTTPRWLINEERLEERLELGNRRGSAIVITVGNEVEASKLCATGLRFGGAPKVVEKYWEAGPSSVCMTCSGIGHDRLGGCGERPVQCVICAGAHKSEDHKCGVNGCTTKRGKICVHVVPKCGNCGGNHQATAFRCPARQKAQALAWKNKGKKAQDRKKGEAPGESHKDKKVTPKSVEMELDIQTDWAASPEPYSELSSLEDNIPGDAQDLW